MIYIKVLFNLEIDWLDTLGMKKKALATTTVLTISEPLLSN